MIIRKYGITLRRLQESDIELVRIKRNSTNVRNAMFFQDTITPEQQKKWFDSVNNIYNYYFVIEFEGNKVGLINGKNIDYNNHTAEGGIFVWEEKLWSGFAPALASICLTDLAFNILNCKKIFAEVRADNPVQVGYNKLLGYVPYTENKMDKREIFVLTQERYLSLASKIRQAAIKLSNDDTPLSWDNIDLSDVSNLERKILYSGNSSFLQKKYDALLQTRSSNR